MAVGVPNPAFRVDDKDTRARFGMITPYGNAEIRVEQKDCLMGIKPGGRDKGAPGVGAAGKHDDGDRRVRLARRLPAGGGRLEHASALERSPFASAVCAPGTAAKEKKRHTTSAVTHQRMWPSVRILELEQWSAAGGYLIGPARFQLRVRRRRQSSRRERRDQRKDHDRQRFMAPGHRLRPG